MYRGADPVNIDAWICRPSGPGEPYIALNNNDERRYEREQKSEPSQVVIGRSDHHNINPQIYAILGATRSAYQIETNLQT